MFIFIGMNARDVIRRLLSLGAVRVRQRGSHIVFRSPCGRCTTVVPDHGGEDIGKGLLRKIERDMTPCFGEGWLLS